jgi:hypothetical protein
MSCTKISSLVIVTTTVSLGSVSATEVGSLTFSASGSFEGLVELTNKKKHQNRKNIH